ncbi:hypothetical protein [Krasilnikovia sp. M28-CT-15]|uniref:hypothetical protein n=1 Tax=Krasilnikovia sp. M28-CT-15 TaxID=3373540 RepID=UPI003877632C
MQIKSLESFGPDYLLKALATTRLQGFDGIRPYADARISLEVMDTELLAPAQRYVLRPTISKITELRAALMARGQDIFALNGGVFVQTNEQEDRIPVIPPIIEESLEPDGRTVLIINDGIHRVFAARCAGLPISVVVIRGVPAELPYYAFALRNGWADVQQLDELPESFQKKEYRIPGQYRSLFRDFNAIFPGVQTVRRQSNPGHLRP